MTKDIEITDVVFTEITDVVFRVDTSKDWKGTIFALMPHECADKAGHVTTYQHVGQHSAADYTYCIGKSRPATAIEFKQLRNELEGLGYNLNIIKKQNYNKYLKSYQQR